MSQVSAETHVFIGVFRPLFYECWAYHGERSGHEIKCPCGQTLRIVGQAYEHWQKGCYDEPVYKTHEEVLALKETAK